jgi:hypothetical protein
LVFGDSGDETERDGLDLGCISGFSRFNGLIGLPAVLIKPISGCLSRWCLDRLPLFVNVLVQL